MGFLTSRREAGVGVAGYVPGSPLSLKETNLGAGYLFSQMLVGKVAIVSTRSIVNSNRET